MPVSTSEGRTRWKRRRRESQIPRKLKAPQNSQDDDVLEDEDDDEEEFNDNEHAAADGNNSQNPNSQPASDGSFQIRESELVSEGGEQISGFPHVIKRKVVRPHSSVASVVAMEMAGQAGESRGLGHSAPLLENISHGQLQVSSMVPVDSLCSGGTDDSGSGSYVISPPPIMKGAGVIKRLGSAGSIHVVPMHSEWFSPYTVNRLERQVVPRFFSGKSADHVPEKYMECRNLIVAKYMVNPEKCLCLDDCKGLVADVSDDDLGRIVRFLDHWGIINYCAAPLDGKTEKEVTSLSEDSNGDLCVPAAALKSIDSLIKFDKPKCKLKAAEIYPDLASHLENDSDFDNLVRENFSEARCNYCSRPTPLVYYQSQKEVDVLLCSDCYHDGRFVVGHSSLDFVKVNSMKSYTSLEGESWTDQEILLLLEGIQLFKENWNEVADHVGTKSKAQCILQFVRLPLDGSPLGNIEIPSARLPTDLQNGDGHGRSDLTANGNSSGFKGRDSDFTSEFPFAKCENPVMALVAFLASAVGPRVAAACAHASLGALSKDDGSSSSKALVQKDGSRLNTEGLHGAEGGSHGDQANSSQEKAEKLRAQGMRGQTDSEATPLYTEQVMAAAKVGLGAAATKAKLFADHEEREIQRLSANIINHRLKRLELKLKQFAEVETLLMRECEQMERGRQRIAAERSLMASHLGSAGLPRPMGPPNISPSIMNANVGNRQQVLSNSLQPSMSGFGGNQPMTSSMSYMPQQSMYGLGPRLPLSAIQPSPSASSMMFSNAANSQQSLGHPTFRPMSGSKSGLS